MFDTMTLTKIVGALCGSFLIFLLGSWVSETIYFGGEGHSEETAAYTIDTGAAADAPAAADGPPFADVYAAADASAGERLFNQCKACHKVDGGDATGPHLNGVVGRVSGTVAGFAYSSAMTEHAAPWTPEEISHFIENPKGFITGTKMGYAGMKKIEDRANLIAYLATLPG